MPTSARERLIEEQNLLCAAIQAACDRFEESTGLFVMDIQHPRARRGQGDKIAVSVVAPGDE
jgi:hypothetical protein